MAVANYCDSNRKHRCLLCGTVSCCGWVFPGLYGRPYGCASPYKHPDRVLCGSSPGKWTGKIQSQVQWAAVQSSNGILPAAQRTSGRSPFSTAWCEEIHSGDAGSCRTRRYRRTSQDCTSCHGYFWAFHKCFCCRKPCCWCSFELLPTHRREE